MNAFESGARKNIPAVLVYVFSRFSDGNDHVLMIHRNSAERPGDFHAGKWNGLGGKCEKDESFLEAAVRELREESTLDLPPEKFTFAGFLQFPRFKPKKEEDWSCMLFTAEVHENLARSVPQSTREGTLHWVEARQIMELNLWEGDREFLPWVLEHKPFYGCTWYEQGKVGRSTLHTIEGRHSSRSAL